jgi:hypothetical protein
MNTETRENLEFAVCINNDGYPASLEIGKLYPVIPDDDASAHGYMRVIDESGEDYAFEAARFFVVNLPPVVRKALVSASNR